MGKKSRLKRESVRYSDTPELPSWVIAPLSGARPVREEDDGDADDGVPGSEAGDEAREEPRVTIARERARTRDEAVPEA